MHTLRISYSDGNHKTYNNIEKVEYQTYMDDISISGDNIFTHKFTLGYDLHLFSQTKNYLISHQGIVGIEVI